MWSQSFSWQFGDRWSSFENRQRRRPRRQGKSNASSSGSDKATHRASQSNSTPASNASSRSWWSQQRAAIGTAFAGIGANLEKMRPKGLQVNVDVDMIKPAVQAVRTTAEENWLKLPPQARSAIRYFSVAFLSGWIVNRINQRTIRKERAENARLSLSVVELTAANEALKSRPLSVLGESMSDYMTTMSGVISQTTDAAARATEAAATAAETCAIRARSGIRSNRGK